MARALQAKRRNVGPICELRLSGEIRRCRSVVPRGASENIGDRRDIRAVIGPQSQDPISDGVPYLDAVSPSCIGKLRQRLLKLVIEGCLEARIEL